MAEAQGAATHAGGANRGYIAVGVTLGVLTVVSLILAYAGVPLGILIPVVIVLAVIQIYLQADVFMHLNRSRRLYTIVFVAGAVVALEVFLATLILMWAHG
ncbi:MAG TPA: cytochrome C oxidase subunit IV family protein [Bacillota bacterium]|nr:cytochrome C oxidase subunit IV family protein [Bacillota bacterium]